MDIPALEEEHTPDAAFRVLETEDTEDEAEPQREESLQAFLRLQRYNMKHSRLPLEEHAWEAALHIDYAVEVVVALHIDDWARRKGQLEEAVRELLESLGTAVGYAAEAVDAIARHREAGHGSLPTTNMAAVVADTPDFPAAHFLWDGRLVGRRTWCNLPYWHWPRNPVDRSPTLLDTERVSKMMELLLRTRTKVISNCG